MSLFSLFFFVFFFISFFMCLSSLVAQDDYVSLQPVLDSAEQEAVHDVLTGVNPEVDWSYIYGVDLCTAGPHGIVCEIDGDDPSKAHVVELNLGYVSEYSNNPSCSPTNASFSPALTRLPYLSKLFFYRCFVSGPVEIPPYIWSLVTLEELVFHSNPALTGPLSPEVKKLVGLRRLIVSGTGIYGEIPAEVGKLVSLQQLDLSDNALVGSVPSGVANVKDLVVIDLSRNALVGSVPVGLGSLKKLSKLDLSRNNLTGGIPASMGSLKSLELLDLSANNLCGGIPLFLGGLGKLRNLHLSGNPIKGSLPIFWNQLSGLEALDLSRTGLVGNIPDSLGELNMLSYLALDHNNLSGSIPPSLGKLKNIHHVDLSRNRLSGTVPFSKAMVRRLGERLRLGGNEELCVESETGGSFAEKIGIASCVSSSSSSSSVELQMLAESSAGNPFGCWTRYRGGAFASLFAVIFFQLFFH